jgi:hypothetical protein
MKEKYATDSRRAAMKHRPPRTRRIEEAKKKMKRLAVLYANPMSSNNTNSCSKFTRSPKFPLNFQILTLMNIRVLRQEKF